MVQGRPSVRAVIDKICSEGRSSMEAGLLKGDTKGLLVEVFRRVSSE